MEYVILILFWILLILAVFTIPFNLPGTFMIVGLDLMYQMVDSQPGFQWQVIGILCAIAISLELFDYLILGWSSRKFGSSRQAAIGAIGGTIIGAVIGSGILPIIGSLMGAFMGAFCGAVTVEYLRINDLNKALRSGIGAFSGVLGGKLFKIAGAIAMLIIIGTH